ncbi:MAG: S9 family peptidase [Oscillospiraceae bacterium]|jgi:Dipeptidyl aminopeptidases/acylaminoacyl-peptidases|nr:S9 family peptidase [Oscillospiraceae bacterium]MBQ4241151.1 S9 family peptidase [Oscillospiraceae bacterium]
MKKVGIDFFTKVRFLSKLETFGDELLFIETDTDMENNGYKQRLHAMDPETGADRALLDFRKRISVDVLDDVMFLKEPGEDGMSTKISVLGADGSVTEKATVPIGIGRIQPFNDRYYITTGTVNMRCPDLFEMDKEGRDAYAQDLKDNEDYIVLDEYPFFFNGAGFINGNRDNLFLLDRETFAIRRIGPSTMDTESIAVDGNRIYFLANDFDSFKGIYSDLYCYDADADELRVVYKNDREYYFRRPFFLNGKLYIMASVKALIDGANIYEFADGEIRLVKESEWMFHNSVGSDCKYGATRSSLEHGGYMYFLTTEKARTLLVRFDGKDFETICTYRGSIDDFVFIGDDLYIIGMKDMKLQEVYKVTDGEAKPVTCLNTEILEDTYVADPERYTIFNVDEVEGWALKPYDFDPGRKYPCILDIHGGPKSAYGEVFFHEMQLWASEGYFVLYCNPHCSDSYGNSFADYREHYGATDYGDIMKFVDKALELYPQIDAEKLGVTGGSYGGYMTNWIITHTDRFKCAASQRSISNRYADFFYSDYAFDTTYENGIPLDDEAMKLFWDRSPIKFWDKAKTPTLFIHSTEDYRCPFPEALQLYTALKINGVETRICLFKGENHELSRSGKPTHRIRRLKEITSWMDRYLKA